MKRLALPLFLSVLAFAGCGPKTSKHPDTGPCASGHACPTLCQASTDCSGGQVCSQGVCANPAPTSTTYDRCYLDSDCAPGDHCSVGVCTHDCAQDADCKGGNVCSNRGRCVAANNVSATPPPEEPAGAKLQVETPDGKAVASLDFGDNAKTRTIVVKNTGGGTLKTWLLSDHSFFSASPALVELKANESRQITLTLDRAHVAGSDATLDVRSNAGDQTVPVRFAVNLSGRFQAHLQLTSPLALGARDFVVELDQVAASGAGSGSTTLSGAVDAQTSASFTKNVPVESGAVTQGASDTQVTFELRSVAAAGSDANPFFNLPILHDYVFSGKVDATQHVSGTVTDTIKGVYASHDIVLKGTFSLVRVGDLTGITPAPAASFQVGTPTPPSFAACNQCPGGGNACGAAGTSALAQAYVQAGFPYYAAYFDQSTGTGGSAFGFTDQSGGYQDVASYCASHACFNPTYALCALKLGQTYRSTLLDVVKAVPSYGILRATDLVASTLIGAVNDAAHADLSNEANALDAAATWGRYALHTEGSSLAPTLPGPLDAWLLRQLPGALTQGNWGSMLPEVSPTTCNPSSLPATTGPSDALHRLVRGLAARLFAERTALDTRQRLEASAADRASLMRSLRRDIAGGELDAAILGDLYGQAGVDPTGVFVHVREDLGQLQHLYENVSAGKNAAGLAPEMTVIERIDGNTNSDFDILRQQAVAAAGTYTTAITDAQNSLATLAHDQTALQQGIDNLQGSYLTQLQTICGAGLQASGGVVHQCGTDGQGAPSGEYGVAADEVSKAYLRLQMAHNDLSNLEARIDIEKRRFEQVRNVKLDTISMVNAAGQKLKFEDLREAQVRRMQASLDGVASVLSSVATFASAALNPATATATLISGFAQAASGAVQSSGAQMAAREEGEIQQARTDIQTDKEVHFIQAGMKQDEIDHAATVQDLLLQEGNLELGIALAQQDLSEKLLELGNLATRAANLERLYTASSAAQGCTAIRDPALHRSLTDKLDAAEQAGQWARYWTYLTLQAFRYDGNVDYGDPTAIFAATNPTALTTLLGTYQNDFAAKGYWTKPQEFKDQNPLSLRKILGITGPITDPVTGKQISAAEQFRRYLLAPEHWQPDGTLKVSFSTLPGQNGSVPIFSPDIYNDRVKWVAAGLVGDNLGDPTARLILEQTGVNALETGTGTYRYYHLSSAGYREASAGASWVSPASQRGLLTAAVNANLVTAVAQGDLVPSSEFQGRAVLATQWSIIFDPNDQKNTDVDLTSLDDIQLLFDHEGFTVQP